MRRRAPAAASVSHRSRTGARLSRASHLTGARVRRAPTGSSRARDHATSRAGNRANDEVFSGAVNCAIIRFICRNSQLALRIVETRFARDVYAAELMRRAIIGAARIIGRRCRPRLSDAGRVGGRYGQRRDRMILVGGRLMETCRELTQCENYWRAMRAPRTDACLADGLAET